MSPVTILVVGLDGASFNLIDPWLEQGLLPNFQELAATGASGELESCIPPVTMPAWRVYSTGKYPGKLGVFWHQQLDPQTWRLITPNATHFHSADLWDYLNDAGYRTGIVGMPDTYPPHPLAGFMVCAGPGAADSGYTYPEHLAEELEREVEYQPTIKSDFAEITPEGPEAKEALRVIDRTFAAAEYLLERDTVQFLQVSTFDINRLQHVFFDGEPTLEAWQSVDRWLGKLTPRFDYTLIMSDHGTERLERAFFLNVWLRQNGYLKTRFHPLDVLPRLGLNANTVGRIMHNLGLTRLFSYETLVKYGSMLPRSTGGFGEFGNQAMLQRLDLKRTRVVALPQGPIYINRQNVPGKDEYERLRDELIRRLEALTDPLTGRRVLRKVYRREEVYHGPYVEQAPDLVALDEDAYHNRAGLSQPDAFAPSWSWKGNNRHNGLFVISGPEIRSGIRLEGVRIVDLAPTILHLCGVAVPGDMDGQVLTRAFTPESALACQAVESQGSLQVEQETLEDGAYEEVIAERLRGLGYI